MRREITRDHDGRVARCRMRIGCPVELMNRPSRRPAMALSGNEWTHRSIGSERVARADYGMNGGEQILPVTIGRSGHIATLSIHNGIVQALGFGRKWQTVVHFKQVSD